MGLQGDFLRLSLTDLFRLCKDLEKGLGRMKKKLWKVPAINHDPDIACVIDKSESSQNVYSFLLASCPFFVITLMFGTTSEMVSDATPPSCNC